MANLKYKKKLKYSSDLEIGDDLRIGGLICTIEKMETVFHNTPDSRIRLTMTIVGSAPKKAKVILFLPHGIPITTLK